MKYHRLLWIVPVSFIWGLPYLIHKVGGASEFMSYWWSFPLSMTWGVAVIGALAFAVSKET